MKLYDGAGVKPKVLRSFERTVGLLDGEALVMLQDDTVLGSGKEGLAITDRRVVKYDASQQHEVAIDDVESAEFALLAAPGGLCVNGMIVRRTYGETRRFLLAGATETEIQRMCAAIHALAGKSAPRVEHEAIGDPRPAVASSSLFTNALMKTFYGDVSEFLSEEEGLTAFAEGFEGSFWMWWVLGWLEVIPLLGHAIQASRLASRRRYRVYATNRRLIVVDAHGIAIPYPLDVVGNVQIQLGVLLGGLSFTAEGRRWSFYDMGKDSARGVFGAVKGRYAEIAYRGDFERVVAF